MPRILVFVTLLFLSAINGVCAAQAHVAVAANFAAPMGAIAKALEKASGHTLILTYGSSGKIFTQIKNGAPFDVFLSADVVKPAQLEQTQLAVTGSRFTYALGTLALFSPAGDDALTRLQQGRYKKLAIANPRLAPYGAAAMQTLTTLELADATNKKLVQGENIAQTYQFAATGNVALAFVALSQVISDSNVPKGTWIVPSEMHEPIRQDAVLLQHGADNTAAKALLEFLRGSEATAIMRRYGYALTRPAQINSAPQINSAQPITGSN